MVSCIQDMKVLSVWLVSNQGSSAPHPTAIDWCCFHYFVRNSPVALLNLYVFFRFVNIGFFWKSEKNWNSRFQNFEKIDLMILPNRQKIDKSIRSIYWSTDQYLIRPWKSLTSVRGCSCKFNFVCWDYFCLQTSKEICARSNFNFPRADQYRDDFYLFEPSQRLKHSTTYTASCQPWAIWIANWCTPNARLAGITTASPGSTCNWTSTLKMNSAALRPQKQPTRPRKTEGVCLLDFGWPARLYSRSLVGVASRVSAVRKKGQSRTKAVAVPVLNLALRCAEHLRRLPWLLVLNRRRQRWGFRFTSLPLHVRYLPPSLSQIPPSIYPAVARLLHICAQPV